MRGNLPALFTRWGVACVRLMVVALLASGTASAVEAESPVGRWITFDDVTHRPRGMIRIYEVDGRLFGRIEKTGDHDDHAVCDRCPGERKGQPLNGLVIIRNMQRGQDDPLLWEGGDVLDPETGKTYRLKWRLVGRGASLVVHGYIGVSLIGRSQTWTRAAD